MNCTMANSTSYNPYMDAPKYNCLRKYSDQIAQCDCKQFCFNYVNREFNKDPRNSYSSLILGILALTDIKKIIFLKPLSSKLTKALSLVDFVNLLILSLFLQCKKTSSDV